MAAVAAIAPLANPYGWGLYSHVFRYLTDSALLSRIGEFQSFDFHSAGVGPGHRRFADRLAGGVLALGWRRPELFPGRAFFGHGVAVRAALPLAALVLLPLANGAIAECCRRAEDVSPRVRSALDGFLAYGSRLRALDSRFGGLALVPLVLAGCLGVCCAFSGHHSRQPVFRRTSFRGGLAHLPAEERLFAPDKFGGYLIYRSTGTRRVFFDGRSDFYGAEFLKQYGRLVRARRGGGNSGTSFHLRRRCCPTTRRFWPPWNRRAGARFTRTPPPCC